MLSSSNDSSDFVLTPTSAYFFAIANKLLNEGELARCKRAAQEYVRSPEFHASRLSSTPCDRYFTEITTSRGCLALNDQLDEVRQPAMRSGHMAPLYYKLSEEYIDDFTYTNLSENDKILWRKKIEECIVMYIKRRDDKVNHYIDGVIKYISDGTLPRNNTDDDLLDKFKKLDLDEAIQLIDRVNSLFANALWVAPEQTGLMSYFYRLFGQQSTPVNNISNPVKDRALQFITARHDVEVALQQTRTTRATFF